MLIQVSYELHAQRAPEIREANIGANRSELDHCIEGKWSSLGHEAGERITVEVVAVCGVGGPVGVCVMRCDDFYQAGRFRYAVKLADK